MTQTTVFPLKWNLLQCSAARHTNTHTHTHQRSLFRLHRIDFTLINHATGFPGHVNKLAFDKQTRKSRNNLHVRPVRTNAKSNKCNNKKKASTTKLRNGNKEKSAGHGSSALGRRQRILILVWPNYLIYLFLLLIFFAAVAAVVLLSSTDLRG